MDPETLMALQLLQLGGNPGAVNLCSLSWSPGRLTSRCKQMLSDFWCFPSISNCLFAPACTCFFPAGYAIAFSLQPAHSFLFIRFCFPGHVLALKATASRGGMR
eukprot:1156257-Pelagomonas_calceolata.AAC.14